MKFSLIKTFIYGKYAFHFDFYRFCGWLGVKKNSRICNRMSAILSFSEHSDFMNEINSIILFFIFLTKKQQNLFTFFNELWVDCRWAQSKFRWKRLEKVHWSKIKCMTFDWARQLLIHFSFKMSSQSSIFLFYFFWEIHSIKITFLSFFSIAECEFSQNWSQIKLKPKFGVYFLPEKSVR